LNAWHNEAPPQGTAHYLCWGIETLSKEFTEGTAARPAGTHTLDAWSWIARARAAAARAVEPPPPESSEPPAETSAGTPGAGAEATAAAGSAQPG
jgi:hypothetical protein